MYRLISTNNYFHYIWRILNLINKQLVMSQEKNIKGSHLFFLPQKWTMIYLKRRSSSPFYLPVIIGKPCSITYNRSRNLDTTPVQNLRYISGKNIPIVLYHDWTHLSLSYNCDDERNKRKKINITSYNEEEKVTKFVSYNCL